MTGFIKGLFSKKNGGSAPKAPAPKAAAPAPKSGDAFFLAPDDAKTFGNIDYMREVKTVERTFPKGKRKPQVRQVSANSYRNLDSQPFSSGPSFTAAPEPKTSFGSAKPSFGESKPSSSYKPSFPSAPTEKRRPSSDSSMDTFRNMAKNIRKG